MLTRIISRTLTQTENERSKRCSARETKLDFASRGRSVFAIWSKMCLEFSWIFFFGSFLFCFKTKREM